MIFVTTIEREDHWKDWFWKFFDTTLANVLRFHIDGRKNITCVGMWNSIGTRRKFHIPFILQPLPTNNGNSFQREVISCWHQNIFPERAIYKQKGIPFQRSLLFCEPICRHPSAAIAVVLWANYCYCCSCWRHFRCQQLHFLPPSFVITPRLRPLTHHRYRKQLFPSPVEAIATNETTPSQSLERTFESFWLRDPSNPLFIFSINAVRTTLYDG